MKNNTRRAWYRLTGSELVSITIVALVIAIAIFSRQEIFSPGPLSAAASQDELGGVHSHDDLSGQCGSCHAAPWKKEVMAELCLKCHTDVKIGLQNPHDLHSMAVLSDKTLTCIGECHTDHRGTTAKLTLVEGQHFSNDKSRNGLFQYSVQGHKFKSQGVPFSCLDCHQGSLDKFDLSTCVTCHRKSDTVFMKTHLDTFGTDCLKCHDGLDTYGKTFDHNKVGFPLLGKHASKYTSCGDCHKDSQTIPALKATPKDCFSCHKQDDTHKGSMDKNCTQCHNAVDWKQVSYDHSLADYSLTGKHTAAACSSCHSRGNLKGTPKDCYSCHKAIDKHQGALGNNCASCHNTASWKQATFDHSKSTFLLTGKHSTTTCSSCHTKGVLKGTPNDCYSCHKAVDKHQGTLGNNCASCHNTASWKQAAINHTATAFPLTGKHSSVACASCHPNDVYKGTSKDCYSCHKAVDKHQGAFGQTCSLCHNTTAWTPAKYSGPHTFPQGHGGAANCQTCHPASLIAYSCYGCHKHTLAKIQSAHRRITNYQNNCVRCHPGGHGD